MYNTELKRIIDEEEIVIAENDCYVAIAKVGDEASVSLEGKSEIIVGSLVVLMKKYPYLRDVVLEAADLYDEE